MAQVSGGGGSAESYVPEGERADAMGSGGRFRIEPEGVERLTAGIDAAMIQLDMILTAVSSVAQIDPPGGDPFSATATSEFGKSADGGAAALRQAHLAFVQELTKTRQSLIDAGRSATNQDQNSASSFQSGA